MAIAVTVMIMMITGITMVSGVQFVLPAAGSVSRWKAAAPPHILLVVVVVVVVVVAASGWSHRPVLHRIIIINIINIIIPVTTALPLQ